MARRSNEIEEERRSYSALFVFGVGLLLVGAVWAIWDDNISRRPWKKYQAEFFVLEADQVRDAIKKEDKRLAADPKYQEVTAKLKQAQERLRSGETEHRLQKLQAQLQQAQVRYDELDLSLRIVKSKIEEAWYDYDEAILKKVALGSPKSHLDALQAEKTETDGKLNEADAHRKQIQNEIAEIRGEATALQKQREDMESKRSGLEQKLDHMVIRVGPLQLPKIPKIEQIVIGEYDRSNFDTPLSRVDRCQTCHIASTKAGFEDQPEPLRTHPFPKLMAKHPPETFACTTCHDGQGPAVNSPEEAHGEVKFWDKPLLRGAMVQANCIRCHLDARHLPHAETVAEGQMLFEQLGCHGCHLAAGYDNLRKVGPTLRLAAAKLDPSWMVRWVKNPQGYRPHTRMPNFMLGEDQATAIVAWLLDSTRKDSDAWLASHPEPSGVDPSNPALVAHGKELVDSLGCRGCHGFAPGESPALLGDNKDIAPNLSNVAEKTDLRWIYAWIKNPSSYSNMARMPRLRLSDEEARAIASFLGTLGQRKPEPAVVAKLSDPRTIKAGKALVRKYGCFGCHDINGMENESRVGVELSTFGSKHLDELFFGNHTDIPYTWDDWTYNKLKNPRTYETERIEQQMPNFFLGDNDIKALRIFLASRVDEKIPARFMADTGERGARLMEGRRLVARYNCVGCHIIEGKGGAIRARYTDNPTMAPPILNGEGAKVQPDWLFGFIKEPVPLRPWLKLRMPTFPLTDDEITSLVEYFGAQEDLKKPFYHVIDAKIPEENIEAGRKLMSNDYFACFSCHQQGAKKPEGPPEGWAPDLTMARRRLNPDWILRWIHDPQALQPGTKMPAFYPGGPDDIFGGDEDRQIRAIRDYIMVLGRPAGQMAADKPAAAPADGNAPAEGGGEMQGDQQVHAALDGGGTTKED